jgi:Domain of unknown function (DUF4288)
MWYTAVVLFKGVHKMDAPPPSTWEEQIVLIHAETEDAAARMAAEIGNAGEHEYEVIAPAKHVLRWQFDHVSKLNVVQDQTLRHGTELMSRFLTESEVASLERSFPEETPELSKSDHRVRLKPETTE